MNTIFEYPVTKEMATEALSKLPQIEQDRINRYLDEMVTGVKTKNPRKGFPFSKEMAFEVLTKIAILHALNKDE